MTVAPITKRILRVDLRTASWMWAALSDSLLQDWVPPPIVKTVLIFGDNDVSFAGQAAAYALARRLTAKGLTISVELPVRTGVDWNDVHRQTS